MNYNEWIKNSILAIDIVDNKIIDRSYNQYDIIANNTEIKANGFNEGIPSIVFHTNKRSHLRIKYDDDFSTLSNNMSLDFYFKLYSFKYGQDLYQRGPYVSSSLSYRLRLEEKRIVLEINYDGTYVFNYNVEDLELNRWYYLALERDNNGIFYLYLDGKLLDKNENYKNTVIKKREGCDLFIGCEDIENIDFNFNGELALYRISNIARWNGNPPQPDPPTKDPEPVYPNEIFQIVINKTLNDGNPFTSVTDINTYLENIKTNIFPELIIYSDNSAFIDLNNEIYKETFNKFIDIPIECHPSGYYKFFGKRIIIYTYNLYTCEVVKEATPNAEAFIDLYQPDNECELLYEDNINSTKTYQFTEYITLSNNISDIHNVKEKFSKWLGISISDIKPNTDSDLYYFAPTWNKLDNTPNNPCFNCKIDYISSNK